ncbi:MAG: hypothetical protein E7159_02265 [Firmicutes bacterium]|nr:hypothetical protein [Bacillota bacterium]
MATYNMDDVYTAADVFVREKLYKLLYNDIDNANVAFDFKEKEARLYLKQLLINNDEISNEIKVKTFYSIDHVDYRYPVIEISNYKEFFSLMLDYAKKFSKDDRVVVYMTNLGFAYDYLFLRMTPDDFLDVNLFLKRNIKMLDDNTFDDIVDDKVIESTSFYEGQILFANDSRAYLYDEDNNQMRFILSDRRNDYCLPVVRYDIYDNNGVKTCQIGSIQDKFNIANKKYNKDYFKVMNRLKYKVNEGVEEELKEDIEPTKLISLVLFIRLLYSRGIKNISIPSMYVLDYDFHEKMDKRIKYNFESKWTEDLKKLSPERYEECYREYLKKANKQDYISKAKTTDFIRLFERLMYHFKDIEITNYPNEVSSYMNIKINSLDNVDSEQIKKILKP